MAHFQQLHTDSLQIDVDALEEHIFGRRGTLSAVAFPANTKQLRQLEEMLRERKLERRLTLCPLHEEWAEVGQDQLREHGVVLVRRPPLSLGLEGALFGLNNPYVCIFIIC